MHGQEKRMLLRHYPRAGRPPSEPLARQLGVSHDTVYRWIKAGELDRDVDSEPPRYGPRPSVLTKLGRLRARIKGCVKERRRTFPLTINQRVPGCHPGDRNVAS